MKHILPVFTAALACCMSCVEINPELGKNLLPAWESGSVRSADIPLENVEMKMADSLSGFSDSRIIIGSLRDETFGLVERTCAINMVPMFFDDPVDLTSLLDSADLKVVSFHLCVAKDTTSWADSDQAPILQNVHVHPLKKAVVSKMDFDCNNVAGTVAADMSTSIIKGTPVINGTDSLSFDFTDEYARYFLQNLDREACSDFDVYKSRFPGFLISTDAVTGQGGRINMFDVQLGFSKNSGLNGNLAQLKLSYTGHKWDAEKKKVVEVPDKDTTFMFYLGVDRFHDIDSLLNNVSPGSLPQYALNLSSHESRSKAGRVGRTIPIEGGGGLKPVISAKYIREKSLEIIRREVETVYGRTPSDEEISKVTINKASLVFPFEFEDSMYGTMYQYPVRLSPICRLHTTDSCMVDGVQKVFRSVSFMNLSDNSNENENMGDIDRHNLQYSPDITFHLRELINMKDGSEAMARLEEGDYDIWLMNMSNETVVTTSSTDEDMSEYYQYLAYQSYYNDMYGGYGGYGYGGYGGYGYNSYSNYYSYMMAAQYAGMSQTSTSTQIKLDNGRYFRAILNGPESEGRTPHLSIAFTIPNIEE